MLWSDTKVRRNALVPSNPVPTILQINYSIFKIVFLGMKKVS